MKNELGMMKDVRDLILRGYGLSQMMDKLELTKEDLNHLAIEYPDFGNELTKRYKITFGEQKVEEKQEVKVQEAPIADIRQTAKNMGIKNWYNKSEERLLKEIAEQLG